MRLCSTCGARASCRTRCWCERRKAPPSRRWSAIGRRCAAYPPRTSACVAPASCRSPSRTSCASCWPEAAASARPLPARPALRRLTRGGCAMRVRVLVAIAAAALWACGGGSSGGGGGGGSGGAPDGGGSGGGGSGGGGGGGGGTLAQGGGDWAQYRGGMRGTSENPGAFDAAEAANLRVVWNKDLSANG